MQKLIKSIEPKSRKPRMTNWSIPSDEKEMKKMKIVKIQKLGLLGVIGCTRIVTKLKPDLRRKDESAAPKRYGGEPLLCRRRKERGIVTEMTIQATATPCVVLNSLLPCFGFVFSDLNTVFGLNLEFRNTG